jgi:hypothetical protein
MVCPKKGVMDASTGMVHLKSPFYVRKNPFTSTPFLYTITAFRDQVPLLIY